MEEALAARLSELQRLWEALMAVPAARAAKETIFFLATVSGTFWVMSRLLGYAALKIHDALDRSLAVLFAVSYNLVLAVLFSSVMVLAIYSAKAGGDHLLRYQLAGFLFVYVMLSLVYREKEGELDEYGLLGWAGGLAAYLLLSIRPSLSDNPATAWVYAAVLGMRQGWAGRLFIAFIVLQAGWFLLRIGARGLARLLSAPAQRLRRLFFFERLIILGGWQ